MKCLLHVSYSWTQIDEQLGSVRSGMGDIQLNLDDPPVSIEDIREMRRFITENHPGGTEPVVIIAWTVLSVDAA